jgi:hypothetical protein
MRWPPWLWPVIIIVSTMGVGLATFEDVHSPIRPVIALWYLLVCPGMAVVRLVPIRGELAVLTLAIALSLALDTIVAGTLLYARIWSPLGSLGVLMYISLAGSVAQLIVARPGEIVRQ